MSSYEVTYGDWKTIFFLKKTYSYLVRYFSIRFFSISRKNRANIAIFRGAGQQDRTGNRKIKMQVP